MTLVANPWVLSAFSLSKPRVLLDMETSWAISLCLQAHFLGESHHDTRVKWCWVMVTSGTNFTHFTPTFYTFSTAHCRAELGAPWHLWASKPRNHCSKVSTCFCSLPCCSTATLPKPHMIMLSACSLGKPICYLSHYLCWLFTIFYGKGLDKICPQHTERPESSRSAAVHFFTPVTQSPSW